MKISTTEEQNPNTHEIDKVTVAEAIKLINDEDRRVATEVARASGAITKTTESVIKRLANGGRLFYIGTGTSGRLGVLDATEIPPTYGVSPNLIQGIIAGGYDALHKAVEASEDDADAGVLDLKERGVTEADAVIGIAASGNTPYTVGALAYAKSIDCFTAGITSNPNSELCDVAEIAIVIETGAEAVTGSTRMKAGTAQKMVLNMISTVTMIKLGYVRGNRMTNLKPSNAKLRKRTLRILVAETGIQEPDAEQLLRDANGDLRVALVMNATGVDSDSALASLEKTNYQIEQAIKITTP